jgi:RpiR family transcriptional regulator, carbohydrate utilization regulator
MIEIIEASYDALPRSEQRVATQVMNNHRRLAGMSIGDIATASHVSKPTVIRFCRSLGYQGFTEFKKKMVDATQVSGGVQLINRSVEASDDTSELLLKMVDASIASLIQYRKSASSRALGDAVHAICRAREQGGRVFFFGAGNSCVVARDARHKFLRLGLSTLMFDDSLEQLMGATLCRENDVVVMISNSGRTKDMLEVASTAKRAHACVVTLTSSGSPLEALSDIHLLADHHDGFDRYLPTTSRLLHLMIIDILAVNVALKIGVEGLRDRLCGIQGLLQAKRYA